MASILSRPQWVNPYATEFILLAIKIYLYFQLFLKIEVVQAVEILV